MPKRYQGNIITDSPVEPSGPYENSTASGVWSLAEAEAYTRGGLWPTAGNVAQLGFFAGEIGSSSNYINKINIATTGNATDVGDLTVIRYLGAGASSSTRGIFCAGFSSALGYVRVNTIDYITMATAGDATDFGDYTSSVNYLGGASNSTRALFAGGTDDGSSGTSAISYITIASTGNATSFGSLTSADYGQAGCASTTRALFAAGYASASYSNVIQYNTIASTGNATDFGDLTVARQSPAGASNATRGLFAGGFGAGTNVIDYVTIASTGNATDFGDLTVARYGAGGASSPTRAVFGGGVNAFFNGMDYVEIATTGNATDFGDYTSGNMFGSSQACSTAHGGIAA